MIMANIENIKIKLQVKNAIGYLILLSPPKNEMDSAFFHQFNLVVAEIKSQSGLRALIILSEGRHFSSGANVDGLVGLFNDESVNIPKEIASNKIAFEELSRLPFPVIACIKGICYGSGLELALCAHFRISTANSLMNLPETEFGIIPGLGGIYNSQRTMGRAKALEFVLSDKTISGQDAFDEGLIDILADKQTIVKEAEEIISLIGEGYKKELKAKYLLDIINNDAK